MQKNISKITGQLSRVDDIHKDRLYHFYKKFGFEINEIPENNLMYANIIKNISQ